MTRLLLGITNFIVGLIELVLGLRVLFRLFGANPEARIVSWIYDTSAPLLDPFRGIFRPIVVEGGSVLEVTTLIAMLLYAILGSLIAYLIRMLTYTERA
jgi:uncharacterized protein YggT (Ycf19 family)